MQPRTYAAIERPPRKLQRDRQCDTPAEPLLPLSNCSVPCVPLSGDINLHSFADIREVRSPPLREIFRFGSLSLLWVNLGLKIARLNRAGQVRS